MDKEKLKKLADNPNNIPGVYNYCNRWCERCIFTSRCLNFSMGEEDMGDPEANDMNNKKFWDKIAETFRITLEMIQEDAKERGIDLNDIDHEAYEKKEKFIKEEAETYPCVIKSDEYADMVHNWMKASGDLFKVKGEELAQKALMEIPGCNPLQEAKDMGNATEIISWYCFQIHVKIMRAVQGMLDDRYEKYEADFPKDSDGSAKVALIGIDQSIGAWGEMMKFFPNRENEILDILVLLEKIRKETEKTFPDARKFVRPGFDEPEYADSMSEVNREKQKR